MSTVDPDRHADTLAAFYKRLTDAGVPAEYSAAFTADFGKGLLTGRLELPGAPAADKRSELQAAAEARRAQRAKEIAGAS